MIADLSSANVEVPPRYEVAIVGSGPAGITLARELSESGVAVCVLESGRRRPTRFGDALRTVVSEGLQIKEVSRERCLGGASTTWAGLSSPLDPLDFEPRAWVSRSGWPIGRDELIPYWERAAQRYRFAPLRLFGPQGFGALKAKGDRALDWQQLEEKVFLACSEPQDFGREWGAIFERPHADLYLDATVTRLEGEAGEGAAGGAGPGRPARPRVARAIVRTSGGRELAFEADVFVLAAGGIENARLLLSSTDLGPAGLGNEHDQVGRGFMNHPKHYRGILRLATPVRELPYYFGCLHKGYAGYAGLHLPESAQRRLSVLNSYVRFEPLFPWSDDRGVEALVTLVKRSRGLFSAWKRRREEKVVSLRDWSETGDDSELAGRKGLLGWLSLFGLVLAHLPMVLRYAASRLREGASPPVRAIRIRNFLEMEPHPENRVTLGEARDALGQRIAVVRHRPTALDRRSLLELHRVLGEEVSRLGLGTLESDLARADPWPIDQDASHHMGGTRMGDDACSSVVDRNGRLHSVDNVFLAGASVFPTSGCANPTFTLVALAIRLAEHLSRDVLSPRAAPATPAASATPATAARPAGIPATPAAPSTTAGLHATPIAPEKPATHAPPAPPSAPARRLLVVGAGKRVMEDVLPVLGACPERWRLAGLFARRARSLEAAGRVHSVRALAELSAADLAACDLVYLAVSKDAVPAALLALRCFDVSRLELLVDTPVLLPRHLRHARLLSAFRRVSVPEDCATLPWIDAVRAAVAAGVLSPPRRVVFERSAWRYHALALAKTLLGAPILRARRRRAGAGARVELGLANGASAAIVEPRDYAQGWFVLETERGAVTDAREHAEGRLLLEPLVHDGLCAGFRLGDVVTDLSPAERALVGPLRPGERVTSRMDDWKRVGLLRLLVALHEGRPAYPLLEALDDMAIDWLLEKTGRFRATPLTSVKSPLARRLLRLRAAK